DLGERSSCLDQIADVVSYDRHHIPILDNIKLIAEVTVPGHDDGSRLARHDRYRGDGQIDETIERCDLALDAAAALDVDNGELAGIEYVAGNDDIGSPEERKHIAIGVCCSLVQYFDRLAVHVHVFARVMKHLGRPRTGGKLRHVPQNTLGRDNRDHGVRSV